jgi:Fe-S-cluster-containing hydrogenase component 2
VTVEPPYCVNCGACKVACPEGAISLTNKTAEELVVPDEKAEERERQRARAARLKKKGEKGLKAGLDALEKLANEDE